MNQKSLQMISKYRTEIMGFAALWIFLFHEWVPLFEDITVLNTIELFIKKIGFLGVDIFFLLSGIGLVFSINKNSLGKFWKNRFIRILPSYIIVGFFRMICEGWSAKELLLKLSGINFYTINIYSFLWFIPAIMTFYLCFPLYYYFFRKSESKGQFTLIILTCWLLITLIFDDYIRSDLFGFTNRIPIFLIGILLGWYILNSYNVFSKESPFLCGIALSLGMFLGYKTKIQGMFFIVPCSECCFPTMLMALSFSFLLAKIFTNMERLEGMHARLGRKVHKFFAFFGGISLEFYCTQELIGDIINSTLSSYLTPVSINILVFILSIFIAARLQKFTTGVAHLMIQGKILIQRHLSRT